MLGNLVLMALFALFLLASLACTRTFTVVVTATPPPEPAQVSTSAPRPANTRQPTANPSPTGTRGLCPARSPSIPRCPQNHLYRCQRRNQLQRRSLRAHRVRLLRRSPRTHRVRPLRRSPRTHRVRPLRRRRPVPTNTPRPTATPVTTTRRVRLRLLSQLLPRHPSLPPLRRPSPSPRRNARQLRRSWPPL